LDEGQGGGDVFTIRRAEEIFHEEDGVLSDLAPLVVVGPPERKPLGGLRNPHGDLAHVTQL
jgi:hypothetical protein